MLIYDKGTMEIDGVEHEAEVDYEEHEGSIVIHEIRAIRNVTTNGSDVWYSKEGHVHYGKKKEKLVVTNFCNKGAWKEEISSYLDYLNSTGE